MPRKEDTEIVRPNASPEMLNPGAVGNPPIVDFSPLFPFLERIAAGVEGRGSTGEPSPTVIVPPEYEALRQLYYACQRRQDDRNWYSVRAIAKKSGTTHSTLYRSKLFMFFYRVIVESLPPEERVRLPKGMFKFNDEGKADGLDAIDD